ncbi:MAG: TlpA disulfide reductase family protein [Bacteroidota bacterium]|nr:TlpA disulfide reductase family protein [Bacteroidota bacterium]
MNKILTTVLLITLCSITTSGREVQLNGNAPGGANKDIQLYGQADPVTGQPVFIEEIQIPDHEEFGFSIDCENVCWLRLRYGIYEYTLVVKEGGSYEFELPIYKAITENDKLNPFFEYEHTHIKVEDTDDINNDIRYIDSLFYNYSNQFARSIYLGEPLRDKDSILESFAGIKESLEEPYSAMYYEYRYCLLRMISEKRTFPSSEDIDLINRKFLPRMPAYTELVGQVFNGYLRRLANDRQAATLRTLINSGGPYNEISTLILEQQAIKDTSLMEFVLLLNLYNEYYKGGFRKEGVEKIIKWISARASNDYNRNLAQIIIKKINRLKTGTRPPDFRLRNTQGEIYTLDSLRGKFTLLVFGNTNLPETKSELDILNTWAGEYKDRLAVVVILLDEDFDSARKRLKEGNNDFIFLDGSASAGLVQDYEIRYLPAFYFLDSNMKLIQSPALLPSENLKESVIIQLGEGFMDDIGD